MNQRRLGLYAAGCVAAAAAGFGFAWSGLYSVAASEGHFAIVDALLRFGMQNSVKNHAAEIEGPAFDEEMVKLGGAHFELGCRACHGAPGHAANPIMQQTLPPAPDLKEKVSFWKDRELFWLVKHGLKYTAMPGWSAQERDDEIWSVAAFVRKLPSLDASSYERLAGIAKGDQGPAAANAASGALLSTKLGCASCHSADDESSSRLAPILNGQPREMLFAALKAYAGGLRTSGIMQPVASQLSEDDMRRLSEEFAQMPPSQRSQAPAEGDAVAKGKNLFEEGDPGANIPSCRACHAAPASPDYPRLLGQNARYIAVQLRLWKRGGRSTGALARIMAPIAQRLSDADIDAVSAYIASQPAEAQQ